MLVTTKTQPPHHSIDKNYVTFLTCCESMLATKAPKGQIQRPDQAARERGGGQCAASPERKRILF